MGLSVMADAPNFEQAMMFANNANRYQHVTPTMWVGEGTMGGLGMGEAPSETIHAVGDLVSQAAAAFQNRKKKDKSAAAAAHPMQVMSQGAPAGGGGFDTGSLTKWLMIGGVVIIGGIVLMKVLKKKKKTDAPEHKEGE